MRTRPPTAESAVLQDPDELGEWCERYPHVPWHIPMLVHDGTGTVHPDQKAFMRVPSTIVRAELGLWLTLPWTALRMTYRPSGTRSGSLAWVTVQPVRARMEP